MLHVSNKVDSFDKVPAVVKKKKYFAGIISVKFSFMPNLHFRQIL